MANKPPVIREVADPRIAQREARKLVYFVVLAQEAGVDLKKTPPEKIVYSVASPYERRGVTTSDIANWIDTCDPPKKPSWDEVSCFRAKARAALKPRMGLGGPLFVIGAVAFLGAFLLSGPKR